MATYKELVAKVIDENKRVLDRIDEKEIETLIDAIMNAKQIQIFAMGRMKLSAHGFAMRLMHLGFNVHFVFDVTCPKIGKGDLLIVNCAVTTISLGIMKLAKEAGNHRLPGKRTRKARRLHRKDTWTDFQHLG
jgi:6-phospho-3-hexuloisomerase